MFQDRSSLRLPEGDLASLAGGHHATPPGRPFARLEQHAGAELAGPLRLLLDLVDLDVREPDRPPGCAFDDPAAEPAAELEREIGAAPRIDQLRPPPEQRRVEGARGRPIGSVQLEMHHRTRPGMIHVHIRVDPRPARNPSPLQDIGPMTDQSSPPTSRAGTAPSISVARLRRRRTAVAGSASRAIAPQTQKAHWKPPVSAALVASPPASSVFTCVAATVEAIATPIAPPSCCEVLSRPEASPASRSATPARPPIEIGMKLKAPPAPVTRNGPASEAQKWPCTGTCVAQRMPPPISAIPSAITGPGEMRVTSFCDSPASANEVSEVASQATPACNAE